MPRTKQKTVYTYAELSDAAKKKARQWYREASDGDFVDFDAESVIDEAVAISELMGISIATHTVKLMNGTTKQKPTVYWSGFSSQGDGACFAGSYSYKVGSVKAVKDYAPQDKELHRIVTELYQAQRRNFYRLEASISTTGRYSHSHATTIEVFDREDNHRDIGRAEEDIKDELRAFMDWIYRQLEKEYEYRQSDEVVAENIELNDYEFDVDGNRD